mmetsp:Transcript_17385/g.32741  ORF Transcript_17385/g.32741 Transcript_17385/m.32741 type:complete len:90 (+) Transcript_17385:523-792(+)
MSQGLLCNCRWQAWREKIPCCRRWVRHCTRQGNAGLALGSGVHRAASEARIVNIATLVQQVRSEGGNKKNMLQRVRMLTAAMWRRQMLQ